MFQVLDHDDDDNDDDVISRCKEFCDNRTKYSSFDIYFRAFELSKMDRVLWQSNQVFVIRYLFSSVWITEDG